MQYCNGEIQSGPQSFTYNLTKGGEKFFELTSPSEESFKCVSTIGVALRNSKSMDDRSATRGPDLGEIVYGVRSEVNGTVWVRLGNTNRSEWEGKYVPMTKGGEKFFELI